MDDLEDLYDEDETTPEAPASVFVPIDDEITDDGDGDGGDEIVVVVERQFDSVVQFVESWFTPVLTRAPGDYLWCRKWFEHAEVLARLTALWNDYESARAKGAMSMFFLQLFDPTVAVICGQSGPFHNCKQGKHSERIIPLKCDPVPADFFDRTATDPTRIDTTTSGEQEQVVSGAGAVSGSNMNRNSALHDNEIGGLGR